MKQLIFCLCLCATYGIVLADSEQSGRQQVENDRRSLSDILLTLSRRDVDLSNLHQQSIEQYDDCVTLLQAWGKLSRAIKGSRYSSIIDQLEQQIMTLHGVDFGNQQVVNSAFCKFASVENINDLAEFLRMPVSQIRGIYHHAIAGIKQTRTEWRKFIGSAYTSYKERKVLQALVDFLDTLENIGIFSLS